MTSTLAHGRLDRSLAEAFRWPLTPIHKAADLKQDPASFDANFAEAYREFKKKINTFARNSSYAVEGYDVEDMEQELCMVLARTVRDYDPDRGASFNTLFQGNCKRRISDLIRLMNTKGRKATIVYLEAEEVSRAVDSIFRAASAEDEYMALRMLKQYYPHEVQEALTLTKAERRRLGIVA